MILSPTYDLGLGAKGNFKNARSQVEADAMAEAIALAEAEHPGMMVHHARALGDPIIHSDTAEEEWMQAHRVPSNI